MAAKEPLIAVALGAPKPKGGSESSESPSLGSTAESLKEMWSAMKSGDFEEAATHFETAYRSCADEPDDYEEASEEEE
jgi:hypothetical protein